MLFQWQCIRLMCFGYFKDNESTLDWCVLIVVSHALSDSQLYHCHNTCLVSSPLAACFEVRINVVWLWDFKKNSLIRKLRGQVTVHSSKWVSYPSQDKRTALILKPVIFLLFVIMLGHFEKIYLIWSSLLNFKILLRLSQNLEGYYCDR